MRFRRQNHFCQSDSNTGHVYKYSPHRYRDVTNTKQCRVLIDGIPYHSRSFDLLVWKKDYQPISKLDETLRLKDTGTTILLEQTDILRLLKYSKYPFRIGKVIRG